MRDRTFCFSVIENLTELLDVGCAPNTCLGKHRVATYYLVVIPHILDLRLD